jgi:RimJ/RimL family protein N-acetyltransferase
MRYTLHEPISKKQQLEWFNSLTKKDLALSIFYKEANEKILIGTIGLYNIDFRHRRATLRTRLSLEYQGKGLGKEAVIILLTYAFNTLNLQKIESNKFADNLASVKFGIQLGSKQEGRLRRHFFHDGIYKDVLLFGILKEDFFKAIEKLD